MDSERIDREREFHNHAFSHDVRRTTDKFYSVFYLIENQYQQKLCDGAAGKRFLEYGCGQGSSAYLITEKGGWVTGIDISDFAIEQAVQKANALNLQIGFKQMDAEVLEFENKSFDVVCGSGIIHHLDIDKAYSEIARVLAPQGKAVFMEPIGHNLLINLYRWVTPNLRTPDEHPLKKADIKKLYRYFNQVELRFFFFSSLFAILFRNTKRFKGFTIFLNTLDQAIFRIIPFCRWQAWFVLIEVQHPKTNN
jgi:ubiquinone/menaquinone biosynthesis C-methylase UbiE